MRLSLSSILSVIILTSIMMLLFILLLKSNKFVKTFGPQTAIVFFGVIILRLALPFEFVFTITLPIEIVYTSVYDFFNIGITVGEWSFALYHLFFAIWIIGSIVVLLIKGRIYLKTCSKIRELCELSQNQAECLDSELLKKFPELKTAYILKVNLQISPMLMGVKRPTILLPEYPYSEEELHYVLGHEALHIRNRDLWWKYFISILACLYWWNPLVRRLQDYVFEMIEIKNDMILTRTLFNEEKEKYIDCLAKTSIFANKEFIGSISFTPQTAKTLQRRFDFICHNNTVLLRKRITVLICAAAMALLTTTVIFEPKFPAPEGTIEPSGANTYAVFRDGKFDVYYIDESDNAIFLGRENDLRFYPPNIKVYKGD